MIKDLINGKFIRYVIAMLIYHLAVIVIATIQIDIDAATRMDIIYYANTVAMCVTITVLVDEIRKKKKSGE